MNDTPVQPTPLPPGFPPPGVAGWSRRKLLWFAFFVFTAQAGYLFLFDHARIPGPRPVTGAPRLQLVRADDELTALGDPTLFALPHRQDVGTANWQRPPELPPLTWRTPEAPEFLAAPDTREAGILPAPARPVAEVAGGAGDLKPAPRLEAVVLAPEPPGPGSTLQIGGALADRPLLNPPALPVLEFADILPPSRVQVLVDGAGRVASLVLLPPENVLEARERANVGDTNALRFARGLRFAPGPDATVGELQFNWRTVPARAP